MAHGEKAKGAPLALRWASKMEAPGAGSPVTPGAADLLGYKLGLKIWALQNTMV